MILFTRLLFYSLATFGLAYVVGHSRISLPIRTFIAKISLPIVELLECPACFGVHLGFWVGFCWPIIPEALTQVHFDRLFGGTALGAYTCGAHYLLGLATGWLKEK